MKSKLRTQEIRTAWIFITPYLIGYCIFHLLPLLISFLTSFSNIRYINKISSSKFIGLSNYLELVTDSDFINAFVNTLQYSIIYVPLIMSTGLLLAILINKELHGRKIIRGMIFMPYVSNMVAIAIIWAILLDPTTGIVNQTLRSLGFTNTPMWLMSTKSSLNTVAMISVWQGVGLQFITYLAALQGIPVELKEAANIDGASKFQVFMHVTWPCLRPTTFLLLITSIIGSFKNFTIIQVLTEGGPGNSSTVLPLNIVSTAFSSMRMGYANAQAIVMFVIIMIITAIQWKGQEKNSEV